jgi:hypothetical protein
MPKFRFEFIEGMSQPAIFADMADRDEAVREAKRTAKEAMLDGIVDGVDPTSWVTKVYDEAGYLVARQLSDAASPVRTSPHQLDLKRDAQPQNPVAVFVPHFNKHLLPVRLSECISRKVDKALEAHAAHLLQAGTFDADLVLDDHIVFATIKEKPCHPRASVTTKLRGSFGAGRSCRNHLHE